jgi:hypothetical protein
LGAIAAEMALKQLSFKLTFGYSTVDVCGCRRRSVEKKSGLAGYGVPPPMAISGLLP